MSTRGKLAGLLVGACCSIAYIGAAPAADDVVLAGPDRPGFTESSTTVFPLHLQAELGAEYSTIGLGSRITLPNVILRLGVAKHVELRLIVPSVITHFVKGTMGPPVDGRQGAGVHEGGTVTESGASGLGFGGKAAWTVGKKGAIGVSPFFVLPVRSHYYDEVELELGLRATFAYQVSDSVSLASNLGVITSSEADEEAAFEPGYMASLAGQFTFTEVVGSFIEVYATADSDFEIAPVVGAGLTLRPTPRFQFDASLGVGFLDVSRGFHLGIGAATVF